jgi:hypothetical protein
MKFITKSKFTTILQLFYFFISSYLQYERGKAFVHANCVFVHEAQLRERCNSSERKRPYSRVLYLILFDTPVESVKSVFKILIVIYINTRHFVPSEIRDFTDVFCIKFFRKS